MYHDQLTVIFNLRDLFRGCNPQHPAPMPDLATPLLLAGAPPQHPHPSAALLAPPPLRPPPRVATPTATPPPPPAPSVDKHLHLLAPRRTPAARSIRDVLFRRKLPSFAELHPEDLSLPLRQYPRVHTSPAAPIKVEEPTPVAHGTRACLKLLPLATASRTFPSEFIKGWAASEVLHGNQWYPLALSVLYPETGKHGKTHVESKHTFHPIRYENIPLDRRKEIVFSKFVCTFRPDKSDPNQTSITITGQNIKYPGNVGTKSASLDLVKLLLNSVLSRKGGPLVAVQNFRGGPAFDEL